MAEPHFCRSAIRLQKNGQDKTLRRASASYTKEGCED